MLEIVRRALAALLEQRAAAHAELNAIAPTIEARGADAVATPDEEARAAELVQTITDLDAKIDAHETRVAELVQIEARAEKAAETLRNAGVQFARQPEALDPDQARNASPGVVRSAAMRIVEEARWLEPSQKAAVERVLSKRTGDTDGDLIARRLVVTESDAYRSAFLKGTTGRADELTERERAALAEVRAMSVGTTTAGGFGVPVLIDPTVLITDGTGLTGLLQYCSVETITTNIWKGVSAGNTAWSFDAEAAEVSDDTSTFAQPSVTAHMARGFIPFSIEVEQDYPGFATQMGELLNDGYMDLLAEMLMTGTGTNQPWGIFITTTTTVDVTTDNTFGAADIDKVWAALPEKFRARATWVMNVDVENDIRGFGSGSATSRFTVDQTKEGISLLNGRPVVLSDYAPTWAGTDAASILVVGDFSKFKVAQRAGMTVEYVPHLTSTGNNRPSGQRGWFAHARVGHDKTVQNAFRKLKNQTT